MGLEHTVNHLNLLLRSEMCAVATYRQALKHVRAAAARASLTECERSHASRVAKLVRRVLELGGRPIGEHGAWTAFTRLFEHGAIALGDWAAIVALERGEEHAVERYMADLSKLDEASRRLVEKDLLRAQLRTHEKMRALKLL